MKAKDLKDLSREELQQKEKALREELFKLNLARYAGRVEKPHLFAAVKKDIARVQTMFNKKEK